MGTIPPELSARNANGRELVSEPLKPETMQFSHG